MPSCHMPMYKNRFYRTIESKDTLCRFEVKYYETDLLISAHRDLRDIALIWVKNYHTQIRSYIDTHPQFEKSLEPLPVDTAAAPIVRTMMRAARKAGVGPMASVAGAMAEYVGKKLLKYSPEVIVENGGDIFLFVSKDRHVGIFAGIGNVYNQLKLIISAKDTPCGICTSSGTIGHSLSFGKTNATVVIARSAAVADAYATAVGNMVNNAVEVNAALKFARKQRVIRGAVIIIDETLSAYGNIRFAK